MSLTLGARLGAYEVVAQIGVGGMGEVYRARDTKLGRDVALKILPEPFASDPDRLSRFNRPDGLTMINSERGEVSHRLPHVLPGGDAVLFTVTHSRFPRWDESQVWVHSRSTGVSKLLIEGGADARYVSSGPSVRA